MPTSARPSEARQFSCEREYSQPQVSVQRADANLRHLAAFRLQIEDWRFQIADFQSKIWNRTPNRAALFGA